MEGGKFSSSSRANRGFPTDCLITRRHKSISGNGSAEEEKMGKLNKVQILASYWKDSKVSM